MVGHDSLLGQCFAQLVFGRYSCGGYGKFSDAIVWQVQPKQYDFARLRVTHTFNHVKIMFIDQQRVCFFIVGASIDTAVFPTKKWERILRYVYGYLLTLFNLNNHFIVFIVGFLYLCPQHNRGFNLALVHTAIAPAGVLFLKRSAVVRPALGQQIVYLDFNLVRVVAGILVRHLLSRTVSVYTESSNRQG